MALDTLFFDLKINDLTAEQIEKIKGRLKNVGFTIDTESLRKQLESIGKNGNENGFVIPDAEELEDCRRRYEEEHSEDGGIVNMKEMMKNFK